MILTEDLDILSQDQGIRGSTQRVQRIQSTSQEFVREEDQDSKIK